MANTIRIENRKAKFDYTILERLECGMSLSGSQVKSIRTNSCSIKDSWVDITHGELFLKNVGFKELPTVTLTMERENMYKPIRLLAHKSEILKLEQKVAEKGMTLVPLVLYTKDGKFKVEIGLCKGKTNYDKRQTIKERDLNRELHREYKM